MHVFGSNFDWEDNIDASDTALEREEGKQPPPQTHAEFTTRIKTRPTMMYKMK